MPEFTDFYSLIANRASNLKEKTFFIDNEKGKTITFEEFHKNTNKVCNILK